MLENMNNFSLKKHFAIEISPYIIRFQISECLEKNTWASCFELCLSLYFGSRFNLRTFDLLKTTDLGKTLHIFEACVETLQVLLLILKESPLSDIVAAFLNKIKFRI